MMLEHLGETEAGGRIRAGIERVLKQGKHVTRDLGGQAHTTEMARAIIGEMEGRSAG
jgi:isocitrate/isopropylmalate dehydrogenase